MAFHTNERNKMAQLNFNAAQVAPDEGRAGPVPAGWYLMVCEASEIKPTKDTTGTYLACTMKIVEGPFANRKVFVNFNLKNNSAQAQEIGHKQLSAFCHAVRQLQVGDSSMLHNIPFRAKLKIRAGNGQYEDQNEITAFRDQSDMTAVNTGATAVGAAGPAPVRPAAPPAAAPAPAYAPPPAAQAAYAPPAAAAPAPAAAPAQGQWAPPAAGAQPWGQPPAAAAAPAQAAPVQAAPAPAADAAQPAWAAAPAPGQMPVGAPAAAAPAQAAPATNPAADAAAAATANGQVLPPWMQGQQG